MRIPLPLPAVLSHRRRAAACADFAATPFHVSLAFIARRDGGAESGRVAIDLEKHQEQNENILRRPLGGVAGFVLAINAGSRSGVDR